MPPATDDRQRPASRRPAGGARARGFTLVELVIVVAIVGILAALAVTSYQSQIRKSARAEAQSFLTDAASRQQQYLVDKRGYAASLTALGATAPTDLAGKYAFTVAASEGPPPTFRITATAQGGQAHDTCGTLTLDSAGNRSPSTCW